MLDDVLNSKILEEGSLHPVTCHFPNPTGNIFAVEVVEYRLSMGRSAMTDSSKLVQIS